MHDSPQRDTAFGYLSAVHSAEHGYFGGYLTISPLGRPLEFHFTAPVQPSRAQQILYGPTLEQFLLGEQIAGSLLAAARLTPQIILTDSPQFEAAKAPQDTPIVLVAGGSSTQHTYQFVAGGQQQPADDREAFDRAAAPSHPAWDLPFAAGELWLQLPIGRKSQRDAVVKLIAMLAARVDVTEPFQRIHEAIREAQRIGARGNDVVDQAA